MPHLNNRVATTTQASFGGRKRIGIQPIRRGRTSRLPVSISGSLGGTKIPNARARNNLGAQVSALKRS